MKTPVKLRIVKSFVFPAFFYAFVSFTIGYIFWPYFYFVKNEVLITVAAVGIWRYSLLLVNYIRATIYAYIVYPRIKKQVAKLELKDKFPEHIYFIIPSYKEEPWVSIEVMQSILSELNNIPSTATLIISTGSDRDDAVIGAIFNAHPLKDKIELVFQRQKDGKRIAMGHALRAVARRYNSKDIEKNSITIFMDGDSYIPMYTLEKCIPIFTIFDDIGAVTTDESAYIDTKSNWYKDWFNLKFGQRHILFQSQSLSRKVLTLTGRFSLFRTSIVVTEDFISNIENDIIIDENYGKFRFLMGDDKSSWYNLMKNGWNMLYIPDAKIYSLESRDGNFLEISQSLPYRWYGNTLRNNQRARALKNQPLFIRYLFYDQIFLMWTSIVGIVGAILLSIFVNGVYLPIYIAWVLLVRIFQMLVLVLTGHNVSIRTVPLMLYSQWIGSYIKIKAFYHLSDQKWSKGGTEVQTADENVARLKYRFAKYFSAYRMYFTITAFLFVMMTMNNNLAIIPSREFFADTIENNTVYFQTVTDDNIDDAKSLNELIASVKDGTTIKLPSGILDIYEPIVIKRSNITLKGRDTLLLSHLKNNEEAVILIKGTKGIEVARSKESLYNKIKISINLKKNANLTTFLLVEQANDETYVKEHMGSKRWYKKYPTLRTEIVEVAKVEEENIYFSYLVRSEIDKNAKISNINAVTNVHLKNISIKGDKSTKRYKHIYENRDKNRFIDGIKFIYAASSSLQNIRIEDSGSNPLVFERSYECFGKNIYIDGSLNKGKNANGYLRFNKTFRVYLEDIVVKNIRHITFQWGSAYNSLKNIYSEVDVNFHGGSSHHNSVDNIEFNVDKKHKWGEIYHTPEDASWASPDYDSNRVDNVSYREN